MIKARDNFCFQTQKMAYVNGVHIRIQCAPITCELDTLSRTGNVDFCQLNKKLLQWLVQSLKHNKNLQKYAHNMQIVLDQ